MTANPIRPISQFASGILASPYNPPGAYLIFGDGGKAMERGVVDLQVLPCGS
jgi:hypothetical protein